MGVRGGGGAGATSSSPKFDLFLFSYIKFYESV